MYRIALVGLFLSIFIYNSCHKKASQFTPSKYLADELSQQHGMELFNEQCASCHSFDENSVGPNLAGVTFQVSKEWLHTFIANPVKMIESGDARSMAQYEKYKQYMPPFGHIDSIHIEHILAYIHKYGEGENKNKSKRSGAITNPIKEKIKDTSITLVLEKWVQLPASDSVAPKARINKMQALPNGRIFIADQRGAFYEITNGVSKEKLNLKKEISKFVDKPGFNTGFGSFAFHPDFETNRLFYTCHTEPARTAKADYAIHDTIKKTTYQGVITEWKVEDKFLSVNKTYTHRELLRIDMLTTIHGMQDIVFNPTARKDSPEYGMLYIGIGDGGAALGGHAYLCTDTDKPWGAVLRIDPLGTNSKNGKYGIPGDNPYVLNEKYAPEIWCRGFRNPHVIAWDQTGSGKMFITNIGQHSIEEVNIGIKGAHYGWPYREGKFLFDINANPEVVYPLPEIDTSYTYPVISYDHDEGNAICGHTVYNGEKHNLLKGKYIFGDIPRGILFYAENETLLPDKEAKIYKLQIMYNGNLTDLATLCQTKRVDLRFGSDHTGELYIFTKSNGVVYKVSEVKLSNQLF